VNDGIHPSERVHLVRDMSRVSRATQVTYDDAGGPGSEVVERRRALGRSRVQNDLVTLLDQSLRCGSAEAVCAAGDEDPRHAAISAGRHRREKQIRPFDLRVVSGVRNEQKAIRTPTV
jgi:hypothetical protein